jgi:hypothetical protein
MRSRAPRQSSVRAAARQSSDWQLLKERRGQGGERDNHHSALHDERRSAASGLHQTHRQYSFRPQARSHLSAKLGSSGADNERSARAKASLPIGLRSRRGSGSAAPEGPVLDIQIKRCASAGEEICSRSRMSHRIPSKAASASSRASAALALGAVTMSYFREWALVKAATCSASFSTRRSRRGPNPPTP